MPGVKPFKNLGTADREVSTDWLARAGAWGIDTIIDLSPRPWNLASMPLIVGVFEAEKPQASWLVVRYETSWMLARCTDGFVSDVPASLPDILAQIDRDSDP